MFAACVISAIVSLATGSSWSTIATVGIALLGIGKALGLYEGLVAGAIISGAYFGDKMSPLSDTTNLAPAMAGTDLITHIRHMAWTTIPTISLTLIIFLVIGFSSHGKADLSQIENIQKTISGHFNVNPILFLVPVLVIFLIIKKVPAIPALLIGALLGGIAAIIFQPEIIKEVAGIDRLKHLNPKNYAVSSYKAMIDAMSNEIAIITSDETANKLLSTGGMYGMLNTIWLIFCAMIFGGIMEISGLLHRITEGIIKFANTTGSLIAATVGTCIFFNFTASDQYLAIVVPGRMYADTYRERGIKPENLSRTLEDSGTVTSVLIPWNTCGAVQSNVLSVETLTYAPYCFFNYLSPVVTVIYGYFGIKVPMLEDVSENVVNTKVSNNLE